MNAGPYRRRILGAVPVLAALMGVGLAVSISLAEIVTVLVLIVWAVDRFTGETPAWSPSPLERALLLFYGWGLFTAALHRSVGLVNGVAAQDAALLYFFMTYRFGRRNAGILIFWFCVASVVCGLLGGLQTVSGVIIAPHTGMMTVPDSLQWLPHAVVHRLAAWSARSVGTRSHPLTYSESLIAPVFVLVAMASSALTPRRKAVLCALGIAVIFWGIFGSQSRGVWLGTFVGFIVLALLSPGGSLIRKASIVVALTIPLVLVVSPSARGRTMSIFLSHQGSYADQKSKETRVELWRQSWDSIRRHPVSGVGLKGAEFVVRDPIDGSLSTWTESHNTFLQVAVEEGLVGFALLSAVLFLVARLILQGPKDQIPYGLALLIAYLIAGLTESWMGDKEIALIFWASVGWFGLMRSGSKSEIVA